jgi:glutathione S-transferase
MRLIIGNMIFSTWSLRPWLVLRKAGLDPELVEVPLYGEGWKARLLELSPTGKVPLLEVDGQQIPDSLAISLWCADRHPDKGLWPADPAARAQAFAVTCEMHSGFTALRTEGAMGMDAQGVLHTMFGPDRAPPPTSAAVAADITRLVEIFREQRARFGASGPYLFGDWSIADAFFTPVATRIRHYQIDLAAHGDDGTAAAYCATLLADPLVQEWKARAEVV